MALLRHGEEDYLSPYSRYYHDALITRHNVVMSLRLRKCWRYVSLLPLPLPLLITDVVRYYHGRFTVKMTSRWRDATSASYYRCTEYGEQKVTRWRYDYMVMLLL